MPTTSDTLRGDLCPSGPLRAVINLGNTILANADAATGQPVGVSVDMARELARQLGVQAEQAGLDALLFTDPDTLRDELLLRGLPLAPIVRD